MTEPARLDEPIPDPDSPPEGDGAADVHQSVAALAARLPGTLEPFARLAYNYRWSWAPDGVDLFRSINPDRWDRCRQNPVRLLQEASAEAIGHAAGNDKLIGRARKLVNTLESELRRRRIAAGSATRRHPIAFLCAEFAVHRSLPIYAGGLGVLAGDILKEASDRAIPMVGVGLLYRLGYFHQRVDASGWQQEYWEPTDPERTPASLVTDAEGRPLTVSVPVRGRDVVVQIWRVDVGGVPLYLLDAERPENQIVDRWITSRLYTGDRAARLAQYALLGIGSVRALRRMGMEPAMIHLNEGHAALAPLELARPYIEAGSTFEQALDLVRERVVFTTHTPVAAGNEGYSVDDITAALGSYPSQVGIDADRFLGLGRTQPDNPAEMFVMTPLGIRESHFANGVSKRHGEVARSMWQPLFPGRSADQVPIRHITNGVHVPTWMAPPMRALLTRHLGAGWEQAGPDEATWRRVDGIPDEELWTVRSEMRHAFVESMRDRATGDRLGRNDPMEHVEKALRGFDRDLLTIGFARRMAGYKRLHLLVYDPTRFLGLLSAVQVFVAGKAHPQDDEGKRGVQHLFAFKGGPNVGERVAFLDDYDLGLAAQLVAGCDLWVNLPRAPLEASGTSGMKAALNGVLNLSVLDGWWCEAFDGTNGWSLGADIAYDMSVQDARDATALYDVLEREIIPLYYERDEDGVPHGWVRRIKASLRTVGPRFSATRMVADYVREAYAGGVAAVAGG